MYAIRSYYGLLRRDGASPSRAALGERLVDLQQVLRQRREVQLAEGQAVEAGLGLGDVDERLEGAQDGLQFARGLLQRRITSYNVCYTKLLRRLRRLTPP